MLIKEEFQTSCIARLLAAISRRSENGGIATLATLHRQILDELRTDSVSAIKKSFKTRSKQAFGVFQRGRRSRQ